MTKYMCNHCWGERIHHVEQQGDVFLGVCDDCENFQQVKPMPKSMYFATADKVNE